MELQALVVDIDKASRNNKYYRRVIWTGSKSQLVLMMLKPSEEIGYEVHPYTDQFIRIEAGTGYATLNNDQYPIKDGVSISVPAGTYHNIVNNGTTTLHLYTIYSPPHHPPNTLQSNIPTID